jgi:hypothetical protein
VILIQQGSLIVMSQINAATPQDTYDHVLGAGAFTYSWWRKCETTGLDATGLDATDDWSATVTCDDGDGGTKTATFGHKDVIRMAARVIAAARSEDCQPAFQQISRSLVRDCRALVFNADEADFDAGTSDEMLQLLVLGEVVFG